MDPVQVVKPNYAGQSAAHESHITTNTTYPDDIDPAAYDALARMVQQHRIYDRQLKDLMAKPWRSAEDKLEEANLKKLKLRQKDEIERLRHEMYLYMGQDLNN